MDRGNIFKIKRLAVLAFEMYFLIFILTLFIDTSAAFLYIICTVFSFIPLMFAIKRRSITFFIFFLLFFLAMGINPFIFFIERDSYVNWGHMDAIGDFSFSVSEYMRYFFNIYIFAIFVMGMMCILLRDKKETYRFSGIREGFLIIKEKNIFDRLCIIICALLSILSLWMFYHKIGMTGITPPRLPFHLSGILYYFRLGSIAVIIPYLYFKSKKKASTVFVICIFAYVIAMTAISKSSVSIILAVVVGEAVIRKRWKRAMIVCLYYSIVYYATVHSRFILYEDINKMYTFLDMVNYSFEVLKEIYFNIIYIVYSLIDGLTGRIYGGQALVISAQYKKLGIYDFIQYYAGGKSMHSIIPNMAEEVFRLSLPEDRSYGVDLGMIGNINMLAGDRVSLFMLQGIIIGLLLTVVEVSIRKIASKNINENVKTLYTLFAVGISAILYLNFVPLRYVYVLTLILFLSSVFLPNKTRVRLRHTL